MRLQHTARPESGPGHGSHAVGPRVSLASSKKKDVVQASRCTAALVGVSTSAGSRSVEDQLRTAGLLLHVALVCGVKPMRVRCEAHEPCLSCGPKKRLGLARVAWRGTIHPVE